VPILQLEAWHASGGWRFLTARRGPPPASHPREKRTRKKPKKAKKLVFGLPEVALA
jgi:hypothetical protein